MIKKLLYYLQANGKCEDFIWNNSFCLKKLIGKHQYYFIENWTKTDIQNEKIGTAIVANEIVNYVFDNINDYVKFEKTNSYTGGSGTLDTFQEIQNFINNCNEKNQKIVYISKKSIDK